MIAFYSRHKTYILLSIPLFINALFISYLALKIGNGFLSIHDSPFFITSIEANKTFGYFWLENSFGSPNFLSFSLSFFPQLFSFLLLSLGIPLKVINLIFYFFILNGIFYSAFLSFSKILNLCTPKKGDSVAFSSLLGAFFYTFNLYMIASWHGGTVDALFLLYAIAPFLLYRVLSLLFREITILDSLILIICVGYGINTFPFALALYLMFLIPYIVFKKNFITQKHIFSAVLVLLIICIISISFTLPIILAAFLGDPFPLRNGGVAYAFSSYGLLGMLKFYFDWTINQYWGGRFFHSYFPYYNSALVACSAIFLWIFVLYGQFKVFTNQTKLINRFLLLGTVLSLFLAKGTQWPFGELNMFFYKYVPMFSVFRTPDTKFGLPVILFFSVLLVIHLWKTKSRILKILIVFFIFVQTIIFFTTLPIIETNASNSFDRVIQTPKEYSDIASIINKSSREERVIMYPGISYGTYSFRKNDGITGQDLLGKLISKPVIYGDGVLLGKTEEYYKKLVKEFNPIMLGNVGIRYVIIRNDVNKVNSNLVLKKLEKDNAYQKVYSSSLASVFRLHEKYFKSANKQITKSGGEVHFKMINPTKYVVNLNKVKNTDNLVFISSFHPAWKLYMIEKNSDYCQNNITTHRFNFSDIKLLFSTQIFTTTHRMYSQFANSWIINDEELKQSSQNKDQCITIDKDGTISGKVLLFFMPQSYVLPMFSITILVTLGILAIIIKKRNE